MGARLVTSLIVFALAAPARAAGLPERQWVRVGLPEAAGIAAVLAGDFILELAVTAGDPPRWKGPILFDDAVHGAISSTTDAGRARARRLSDFGLYGLAAFPLIVDAGLVTWLGRGDADGAVQLALVDLEALALAWGLTTFVERTVSRARPFEQDCVTNPARADCSGSANDRNTSFPSGHTSVAFAMATVLCVEHTRLDLYGKADALVCPLAMSAAAATGVLRIVGDKHWASDVLAGAALGASIGALAGLVHTRPRPAALSAIAAPGTAGLALRGQF